MNTQGFGDTKPVAAKHQANGSDDPEGRQKNRQSKLPQEALEALLR